MKINVRRAMVDDVKAILALSHEIMEDLKKKDRADYFCNVDIGDIREAMRGFSEAFVAVDMDKEVVGFILALQHGEEFSIAGYGVKPGYQGQGIANLLMKEAVGYATKMGANRLVGTIHPDNIASQKALHRYSKGYIADRESIHAMKDGRNLRRKNFCVVL